MTARFYHCPVAEALSPFEFTAEALALWRWSDGGRNLRGELPCPTIAARVAMDIISDETALHRALESEYRRKKDEAARNS